MNRTIPGALPAPHTMDKPAGPLEKQERSLELLARLVDGISCVRNAYAKAFQHAYYIY